ncbi:hypothetical protein ABW19_dt0200232 [Dactylella cylindrospora]|nr:hypothetical protein ABW19_dt0200232 [Dactylella cylindrospora]
MERFLNANYHTPQLPTTSTTSQRPRPHMIQPNSDQLLTLSEFLRESSPSQPRSNNSAQTPTHETSAIQQWLGLRGSNGNRSSSERRDMQTWERGLSPTGIPSTLAPASAVLSPSTAAATISNPPSTHRRSASTSADWPPSSSATGQTSNTRSQDSFQTLVNQIRRIGALQDYMLNSVDETAASLEESLNLHSQAVNRALNSHSQSQSSSSATRDTPSSTSSSVVIPDVNSQGYYTSLRVREARIRTMQSRIDLLASEFALLRTTRRELRRAESEALNMFQSTGAISTPQATGPIEIPTVHSQGIPREQDTIRTEVDEVDEALDAEGNSSRRVLRSTFLPAELGDEAILQHFEREQGRARVREGLARVRRELEAEQARSTEIIREARRRANAAANGDSGGSGGEEETEGRRRRYSVGSVERSQSERRA